MHQVLVIKVVPFISKVKADRGINQLISRTESCLGLQQTGRFPSGSQLAPEAVVSVQSDQRTDQLELSGVDLLDFAESALTVVCGVLEGSDVEEGGAYPVQSHVHITDGLENYLRIEVLHQVAV
ncbi:hypothetical protein EYF80_019905 [Liparis tanakae]|uniref:Uncharacterized protein n=1 Tax=Liparis tanakae TaxID=230148 RepID=A0A4Z2HVW0_9TELE|nr:hypothetical protein EYF80_019905 [Liparis tanakae]